MGIEENLGWGYFVTNPTLPPDQMTKDQVIASPRMQEHMSWHADLQNLTKTGNYGERFLLFHQHYVEEFDAYRISQGFLPVTAWDPSTPIPAALSHDYPLMDPRDTDYPYSIDPACKTPTWATFAGGSEPDPIHGYTRLGQFQSLDELGRSIDSGWHGTVHNTIGGDMSHLHSPIDPIFWRWHKWVDNIRASWVLMQQLPQIQPELAFVRILFGVINDAPGKVIGPDGKPHPVPGGPDDPTWRRLSPARRDILVGLAMNEIASLVSITKTREQLQKISRSLIGQQAQHLDSSRVTQMVTEMARSVEARRSE